jgi:hypothetical protein
MKVIGWWSGGVTSAVACKLVLDLYGKDKCRIIFIDTMNEDDDTYRFKEDCERWYGVDIETITGISDKFPDIQSIWRHYKTLNTATGAICSSTLKRDVRLKWEKENEYSAQVFGFDLDESKRAKSMSLNHKQALPIYPLMMFGYFKKDCIRIIEEAGLEVPNAYKLGYSNNNCLKTMCIQGGLGYWQKVQRDDVEKFNKMAAMEHELTDLKGEPVTMNKDQSKAAKESGNTLVFLKPHPKYPNLKDLSMMEGREVKPLMECNGFCGTNDFEKRNETENEINFQTELELK